MFNKGEIYRRVDLHKTYGGQRQGGISTPSKHNMVMIFSGPTGEQYGYADGWTKSGKYRYTGEGQIGDMQFVRGNRAIRDHLENGTDIHLFEYIRQGFVEYIGEMRYENHFIRQGKDKDGHVRQVIIFELVPVDN
jgi:5-methylcytosine-specific restriction enzyme A